METIFDRGQAATSGARRRRSRAPYWITAIFAMPIFGFYGAFLPFGLPGIVGFAGIGLLWALLVGVVAHWLMRRTRRQSWPANAPVFVSIMAIGLLAGAGYMYIMMMHAAVKESSTTYATLSVYSLT